MKLNFRIVFWSSAAALVVLLLALAFRPRAVAVDIGQTTRGPLSVTVRDEGRTRIREVYEVRAPVGGQLLRVEPEPGDVVQAGQPLARIMPVAPAFLDRRAEAEAAAAVRSAEASVAAARSEARRAEAEAEFAATELARLQKLHADGLISQDELDRAERANRVAQAGLEAAREAVRVQEAQLQAARVRLMQPGAEERSGEIVTIRSPVSGRVLTVDQESATVLQAGALIMTVGDPNDLEVVIELLSTDAVQVRPGARAMIDNWDRSGAVLKGKVRLVEPHGFLKVSALGVEEQRVNVILDFDEPPEKWAPLGHGYRVEAAIVTWEAENVLQAPLAALFRSGGQWAVFRVVSGRARLTPVEVGRNDGRHAEILSGLEESDTLILYPGEQVNDGVRVRPRESPT